MENTIQSAKEFSKSFKTSRLALTPSDESGWVECMVAYASSVRPVVVLPSEEEGGCIALDLVPDLEENEQAFFIAGFQTCIRWLNNNPDLTFTELNHEK